MAAPDGFPLAVQVAGRADGPVLLLLAGQANFHVWWTGLREQFEDHFRVVTFDYRGTGGSRGPVGEWSTPGFADDAAAVLRALTGGRPASVYGTSMGGRRRNSWLPGTRSSSTASCWPAPHRAAVTPSSARPTYAAAWPTRPTA